MRMMYLIIEPKSCLHDEKVRVRASGLLGNALYTLTANMQDERKKNYFSYAYYKSDHMGMIDTCRDESAGGSYTGLFPMGLIGALKPAPNEYQHLRMFKRNVEIPSKIEIRLYEGHKGLQEIVENKYSFITNGYHYRHYMGPGVKRIPIRGGRVRGTLFIPAGEGPFPGVVDMFGSAGGLLEYRASQLASRGVAALAVAYFAYDDLPRDLERLDLDYFREAVHILLKRKEVIKPHVGAIGVSKGVDIVLAMATFIPEVSFGICINGSCSVLSYPTEIKEGYTIPPLLYDLENSEIKNKNIIMNFKNCQIDPKDFPETIIPVEMSDAKFLFIVGGSDQNLDYKKGLLISADRLDKAGKKQNYKLCVYPGAGHLIEPPYSPFCFASYHKFIDIVVAWGGELRGHIQAQEESWEEMLHFINSNLKKQMSKL